MSVRHPIGRITVAAMTVMMVASVGVLALVDTRTVKEKALAWVESHPNDLPATLAEMSRHPLAVRREAFLRLTPERQAALWREQLETFRSKHQLTSEQRDAVSRMLTFVVPDSYARPEDAPPPAGYTTVCADVQRLFSVAERQVFSVLGDPLSSPSPEGPVIRIARAAKQYLGSWVVEADAGDTRLKCDCSADTYCPECQIWTGEGCGFGTFCDHRFGCGCTWLTICTGYCIPIISPDK